MVGRIPHQDGMLSPRGLGPAKHRDGTLLKIDGSHHAWPEVRGARFTLMKQGARCCRLPLTLYSDRHGVLPTPSGRRTQRRAT